MLAFYRGTNDYLEVFRSQRKEIQCEDFLAYDVDDTGSVLKLACYEDVYEVEAKIGFHDFLADQNVWGKMAILTQLRWCGKFTKHSRGRLPADLLAQKEASTTRRIALSAIAIAVVVPILLHLWR